MLCAALTYCSRRCHLYMSAHPVLSTWLDFQSPPKRKNVKTQLGKGLPHFGPYEDERRRKATEYFKSSDILDHPAYTTSPSIPPPEHELRVCLITHTHSRTHTGTHTHTTNIHTQLYVHPLAHPCPVVYKNTHHAPHTYSRCTYTCVEKESAAIATGF